MVTLPGCLSFSGFVRGIVMGRPEMVTSHSNALLPMTVTGFPSIVSGMTIFPPMPLYPVMVMEVPVSEYTKSPKTAPDSDLDERNETTEMVRNRTRERRFMMIGISNEVYDGSGYRPVA